MKMKVKIKANGKNILICLGAALLSGAAMLAALTIAKTEIGQLAVILLGVQLSLIFGMVVGFKFPPITLETVP